MITVIDSGIANIGSVMSALRRINAEARVTTGSKEVIEAQALLLPGVGAFADGMESLRRNGLIEAIRAAVAAGTPLLGICLGMQLLADVGEEFGEHEGLGLIPGRVARLQPTGEGERVPNMGWCDVTPTGTGRLFTDIPPGTAFYFVHSYYFRCAEEADVTAAIHFGGKAIAVAVERKNVFGAQFHPEKSQDAGLTVLSAFVNEVQTMSGHD